MPARAEPRPGFRRKTHAIDGRPITYRRHDGPTGGRIISDRPKRMAGGTIVESHVRPAPAPRPRASRGKPVRRRGSRRITSRARSPDDPDGDPEPAGATPPASRRLANGVQLSFDGLLPLEPAEVATLSIFERTKLYAELDLHPIQRQAAEEAVRLVIARRYRRRR